MSGQEQVSCVDPDLWGWRSLPKCGTGILFQRCEEVLEEDGGSFHLFFRTRPFFLAFHSASWGPCCLGTFLWVSWLPLPTLSFLPSLFLLKLYPSSAPCFLPINQLSRHSWQTMCCGKSSDSVSPQKEFLPLLKLVSISAGTPRATAMCL
jgi:hypothetical protein